MVNITAKNGFISIKQKNLNTNSVRPSNEASLDHSDKNSAASHIYTQLEKSVGNQSSSAKDLH